jgi:DNA-binding CsgD family transcriptional regulator
MLTLLDLQTFNHALLELYSPNLTVGAYPQAVLKFLSQLVSVAISPCQIGDLGLAGECLRKLSTHAFEMDHFMADTASRFGLDRVRHSLCELSERDRLLLTLARPHLENAFHLACAKQRKSGLLHLNPQSFQSQFSPREAEIAYWLTQGKSNAEISQLTQLHVQTVKGHVTTLFDKTGCSNRLALTLHLIELARKLRNPSSVLATKQA